MPGIFTRVEAAAFCRLSLRSFDRHVRPAVTPARPLYPLRFRRVDLVAWMFADVEKGAPSQTLTVTVPTSPSVSAKTTRAERRKRRRESTWQQYQIPPVEYDDAPTPEADGPRKAMR